MTISTNMLLKSKFIREIYLYSSSYLHIFVYVIEFIKIVLQYSQTTRPDTNTLINLRNVHDFVKENKWEFVEMHLHNI